MQQHRALILRSNRFLGSTLVDKGLVSASDLEAANEQFMDAIQSPELLEKASILASLLYDLKVLDEGKLLTYLTEEHGVGLVDLSHLELRSLGELKVDLSLCRASSTVPFDKVEGTYLVASCYYMSAPVVKCWEEKLDGKIVWYGTSMLSLTRAFERLEEIQTAEEEAAAEEDEEDE